MREEVELDTLLVTRTALHVGKDCKPAKFHLNLL